jgi:cytochrome P450
MSQPAPARHPPAGVPQTSLDPFSLDFLRDPHPAHEALREAGPVVWLEKVQRLCRGAARRGQADPQRSRDLLFEPWRGLERLSTREAVADAERGAGARPART